MAHDADQLRARLDEQRSEITGTVEEIENRIMPRRIVARRRDRIRRRLTDWKDNVFGNDEPDYPYRGTRYGAGGYADVSSGSRSYGYDDGGDGGHRGFTERAGDVASSASDTIREAPTVVRRETRGNPMAAGLIALGTGWLVGSVLPRSEREQALARKVEPALAEAAAAVKDEGRDLAQELKEPAREAADEIKHRGQEAAHDLRDEAKEAAGSVRSTAGRSGQPGG